MNHSNNCNFIHYFHDFISFYGVLVPCCVEFVSFCVSFSVLASPPLRAGLALPGAPSGTSAWSQPLTPVQPAPTRPTPSPRPIGNDRDNRADPLFTVFSDKLAQIYETVDTISSHGSVLRNCRQNCARRLNFTKHSQK